MNYQTFLESKRLENQESGFEVDESEINPMLFDFQKAIVKWACRKGRCAIFADCGLGKTPIQLEWSKHIIRRTNKRVLIITPLSVSHQTIKEGGKFGVRCTQSRDGEIRSKITVTNYERLHYFNPMDFVAAVCDESSAIKHFGGSRQKVVTEFMKHMKYRLLCTATAAPNDYIELGTSAEALGEMGRMDMLGTFFKNDENSLHPIWWGARWRFKAHAEKMFWQWVCSWAKALRKPSDMGFNDDGFILPPLHISETIVSAKRPRNGMLFVLPAITLNEQREERKITLKDRCQEVAKKLSHNHQGVAWCHLNAEADYLENIIPDAKQVSGSDSDESKEAKFIGFVNGDFRVLITKPKIGAFGLNWQHCSHMTFFPSHSFEQWYQGVRRCWRFGQKNEVTVDMITTEGEKGVLKNLQRKNQQADKMFSQLIRNMNMGLNLGSSQDVGTKQAEMPEWL